MQNYVLGFAFEAAARQVALILKQRPAWQADKLNGIGGKIEPGETPTQAMVREFREECGVATEEGEWQLFAIMRGQHFTVYTMRMDMDADRFGMLRSCTDEPVLTIPLDSPRLSQYAIPNVPWLVSAAQDPDCGRMVLTVEYGEPGDDLPQAKLDQYEPLTLSVQ